MTRQGTSLALLLLFAGCASPANEEMPTLDSPVLTSQPVCDHYPFVSSLARTECAVPVYGTLTVHHDRECTMTGSGGFGADRVARSFVASVTNVAWTPTNRTFDPDNAVVFTLDFPLQPDIPESPSEGFFLLEPFDLERPIGPGDAEALAADPMHLTCPVGSVTALGADKGLKLEEPTQKGYVTETGVLTERELLDLPAECDMPRTVDDVRAFIEESTQPVSESTRSWCPDGHYFHFINGGPG